MARTIENQGSVHQLQGLFKTTLIQAKGALQAQDFSLNTNVPCPALREALFRSKKGMIGRRHFSHHAECVPEIGIGPSPKVEDPSGVVGVTEVPGDADGDKGRLHRPSRVFEYGLPSPPEEVLA